MPDKAIVFEPMPGKIVVQAVEERSTFRPGGKIVKPATIQQPRVTAKVVAVYEPFLDVHDKEETTPFVEVGDLIMFGRHSGVELEFGEERYICLRESEILTKVHLTDPTEVAKLGMPAGKFDHLEALGDEG